MSGGGFYRGTSQDQDARFSNKDKKLLNSMKWPEEFSKKVDLKKVNFEVIKDWINKRITELLGFEDDVVINLVVNSLETPDEKGLDPRKIQLNLAVFLQKNASKFTKELWNLLLEAQDASEGIPQALVENKKEEIISKKEQLKKEAEKLENLKRFLQPSDPNKEAPSNLNKLAQIMKEKRIEDVSNPNVAEQQVETSAKQLSESSKRREERKNERSERFEKTSKHSRRREDEKRSNRKERSSSRSSSSSESRERQKSRKQKQRKYRSRSRSASRSRSKERERKNRNNDKSRKDKNEDSRRHSKKSAPSKSKKEESSDSDSDSSDSGSASSNISSSDSE